MDGIEEEEPVEVVNEEVNLIYLMDQLILAEIIEMQKAHAVLLSLPS